MRKYWCVCDLNKKETWKNVSLICTIPLSAMYSQNKYWHPVILGTCWQPRVFRTSLTQFLVSPLTVANINTCESDGRNNHTAAAMEQWSSASLPLTGGFISVYLHVFSSFLPTHNLLQKCHFWLLPPFVFCFFSVEELCLELARAIEAGDTQAASQHASALARQKAALTIQLSEKNYADGEIGWEMSRFVQGRYDWCFF